MPRTEHRTIPASGRDPARTPVSEKRQRPRWLIPVVVVAVVAVVAGVAVAAVLLTGEDVASPEDVVAALHEAAESRDIDALEALYDPEVVITADASRVGFVGEIPDLVGRAAVVENAQTSWEEFDPTVTYEILEVDGRTVTTTETLTSGGGDTRHTVTYQVSEEGLIVRVDRVVEE